MNHTGRGEKRSRSLFKVTHPVNGEAGFKLKQSEKFNLKCQD